MAVRADDKDLAVNDVKMICYFARHKLQLIFEDALGSGLVKQKTQEVLDFPTWEDMMACGDKTADDNEI